ncbi:hypothetical protein NST18_13605 [Anoxybacillus sp. FSL W8-0104]|uniref:hypothetical protein n=1 Tax=unclassified Anoxybacillus TaxID=2639704 RepID=UPI0030F7EB43
MLISMLQKIEIGMGECNLFARLDKAIFYTIVGAYIISFLVLFFHYYTTPNLKGENIRNFIHTIVNASVTASVGFASIIVAIVVALKSQLNEEKKQLVTLIRGFFYYVIFNLMLLVLSYFENMINEGLIVIFFVLILSIIALILFLKESMFLITKVLNIRG